MTHRLDFRSVLLGLTLATCGFLVGAQSQQKKQPAPPQSSDAPGQWQLEMINASSGFLVATDGSGYRHVTTRNGRLVVRGEVSKFEVQ